MPKEIITPSKQAPSRKFIALLGDTLKTYKKTLEKLYSSDKFSSSDIRLKTKSSVVNKIKINKEIKNDLFIR
jgi:hypothetical protein